MATYRKLQVHTKTTDFRAATEVVTVPLSEPAVDKVRVRVIYAGVNASDINMSAGRYFTDGKLPFDIGMEGIGLVDSVGAAVTKFKAGQPVLIRGGLGAFSEYVYCSEESMVALPELNSKFLVGFVTGLTSAIGLDKCGRIEAGDKVLVTAAAGGTGQIAVQWAKQKGCYVIGLTSSEEKAQFLKQLGADFVINYRTQNLDQVLKDNFPEGIDVIWETIGGETFKTLFNHLSVGGRMVIIGSIQSYKETGIADVQIEDLNLKLLSSSRSLNGFLLSNWTRFFPEYLTRLITLIATNKIIAQVDNGQETQEGKFLGLEQIARAEEHLHSGKNKGKVVVQIQNV